MYIPKYVLNNYDTYVNCTLNVMSVKCKLYTRYHTSIEYYIGPVKDQLRHFWTLIEFKIKVSEE